MRILEIEKRISVFWCSFPLVIPLEYLCLCFLLLYATTTSHINLIARTGFVTGGHYGLSTGRETSATLFPSCRSSCTRVRTRFPLCPLTSSWFHLDLTESRPIQRIAPSISNWTSLKFDRARGVITVDFQTGDRHHSTHWNFLKMKVRNATYSFDIPTFVQFNIAILGNESLEMEKTMLAPQILADSWEMRR